MRAAFRLAPLSLALTLFAASARAEPLEGRLLERGTRVPLGGVNVFVLPHRLKATTDAGGRFRFDDVPAGEFEFVVNASGYERLTEASRTPLAAGESPRTLYLQKTRYAVYETTVVGQSSRKDDAGRSMKASEILQMPGSGNDPLKAIQNLPGINRPAPFSAQVIIQGSAPQDTAYQIDGHEVPIIFHFGGLTSVVPPESLDRVEYLAAGYGPVNGRAIGGIVGAWTRTPRTDRVHALAYLDTFNAGAVIEGPAGEKGAFLVGARQSYVGALLKGVLDSETFSLQAAPTFSDLTAIYEREVTPKDRFRLVSVGSIDSLELLFSQPNEGDSGLRGDFGNRTAFFRLIPQWTHRHSERTVSRWSLGFGRDTIRVNAGENFFDLGVWQLTARGETEWRPSDLWVTQAGFDNSYGWADVNLLLPLFNPAGGVGNPFSSGQLTRAQVSQQYSDLGLWWRNEVRPSAESPWTFLPGVRLDWFESTDEVIAQPRLGARYAFSPSLTGRVAGGLYAQAPQEQEVAESVGNPDLRSPRAWHLSLGADRDFRGGSDRGWTLSGGAFFRHFQDLVAPSTATVQRNGATVPEFYTNDERGRAYGLEALARWDLSPWSGWVAYTLARSERWGAGQGRRSSPFDQTHLLTAIAARDLPRNWRISARLRYVTGNPLTPVTSGVFDADSDAYFPIRGPFFSTRLAPFAQLDLRVDKRWVYDTWILSLYLDIQNATNRMNSEQIEYAYDYRTSERVSGLPIFPIFGLRAEF